MTAARILTVSAADLAERDDAEGRLVAQALRAEGLPIAWRQVVDEDEADLAAALAGCLDRPGLVVVLARPGGSSGEIVRRTLARLLGLRLVFSERLLAALEEAFAARGQAMPRRMDRLALLPQGAELWTVAAGEPGWLLDTSAAAVAVLPLGSVHLPALVQKELRAVARERRPGRDVAVRRTLRVAGLGPAEVEERLARWLGEGGPVTVSAIPVDGDVWVRLDARASSRAVAEAELALVESDILPVLGPDCYGRDDDQLEAVVGRLLLERGLTVSVAESCTGGLVGHRLTDIPGSSRYFERGVMVYSNRAKEELLGVPGETLRAHGAVSAPVALAMASGICRVSGSPCGLAITGIAGPDGGSAEKPVGTVYIAVAGPAGVAARRFLFPGGRAAVKWASSQAALDLLRRALLREG
ncbi:MAG: nicotinamide-nucleotide amidohydrolase family protein [Candidatus Rokubacteria bacterium]|nr:nicotinamide-nucleotide amidohydrolase family protein [Candidatus Rokubacteria bacterium]